LTLTGLLMEGDYTNYAAEAIAGAVIVLARLYDVPTAPIAIVSLAVLFRWKVPEPVVIGCAARAGLLLRSRLINRNFGRHR
jgi:hypothetical protein